MLKCAATIVFNRLGFVALLVFFVPALAQEPGAPPSVELDSRIELPSKFTPGATARILSLDIDRLGLKIRGNMVLSSLAPPTGRILLETLKGDPQRIMAFLAGWVELPRDLSFREDITTVTLKGAELDFGGEQTALKAQALEWPDGRVGPIIFQMEHEGHWALAVDRVTMSRLPVVLENVPELTDIEIANLKLNGGVQRLSLAASRWVASGSQLEDLAVELIESEREVGAVDITARADTARMDLEEVWKWAERFPTGRAQLDRIKSELGLKSVQVHGALVLSALGLSGVFYKQGEGSWRVHEGHTELSASDVSFVFDYDQPSAYSHQLLLPQAVARVQLDAARITIDPLNINAADGTGGKLGRKRAPGVATGFTGYGTDAGSTGV